MRRLRIGYVPLTDAAVLIAAATHGFAESDGLVLELVREVSWANIRDKLILGHFDATHILAPFAVATSLGLGDFRAPHLASARVPVCAGRSKARLADRHRSRAPLGV